ncbi:MAG: hypothetical protein H7844_15420 [Nitrospirae bacterium YQR-1]
MYLSFQISFKIFLTALSVNWYGLTRSPTGAETNPTSVKRYAGIVTDTWARVLPSSLRNSGLTSMSDFRSSHKVAFYCQKTLLFIIMKTADYTVMVFGKRYEVILHPDVVG